MHRIFAIGICLVLFAQITFAASIKVKHFAELSSDIKHRTEVVRDGDNNPCALIKVIGADASYKFDNTYLVKTIYKQGETWLYMAVGAKSLTIKQGSKSLKYEFPVKIEYMTYELALLSQEDFNKAGAIATSCFIPGVGQMAFKDDYLKGSLILVTELGSIAAIVACNSLQLSFKKKSDMATTAEDKVNYMKTSDNYGTARNIMIGVAAGIYLYNVLDIILAKPRPSRKAIAVNPYIENINSINYYGVNVAVKF